MVIQHNIAALNSHRNLGINNSATSKNLEKLSSGYRINRAGDDAAGLAISEKMRGQIRGLAMAEQNTENGISLIQTAEGGLNETHAILQRMRELSVQASNGTYQDDDRKQIAIEVQALKDEIDRIASSTHYNGIKLLNGSLGGDSVIKAAGGGTVAGKNVYLEGSVGAAAKALNDLGFQVNVSADTTGPNANVTGSLTLDMLTTDVQGESANLIWKDGTMYLQVGDKTYKGSVLQADDNVSNGDGTITQAFKQNAYVFEDNDGNAIGVLSNCAGAAGTAASVLATTTKDFVLSEIQLNASGRSTNIVGVASGATAGAVMLTSKDALYNAISGTVKSELIFQIGANGGADQRVGLHVENMSTATLGLQGAGEDKIWDISINTREEANDAIKVIDAATNQVSAQRASLGALQNRLEHTLNNLGVTKENLTAAESTIRDVDMAKEMMEFTKNNILVQASQAMLAQANALPQGVLSLLR